MRNDTRILVFATICCLGAIALWAQTPSGAVLSFSMTGTGQTITGNTTIQLAPSTVAFTCTGVLQKGGSVPCNATLDQPVPLGMTGTVALTVTGPTGVVLTVLPASITFAGGTSICGNATTPCATVSRQ